jgi:3',5'-cyclic AMP phosphodiesterase CpdA
VLDRRGLLRGARLPVAVIALSLFSLGLGVQEDEGTPVIASQERPLFTFVSMPDFLNTDIGDTHLLPGKASDARQPTSITPAWTKAVDVILDSVRNERPDVVLVAGDLVEGHWGADVDNTGIFGPVRTTAERMAAVSAAGDFYYGQWQSRFDLRGLRVLPAIGDHEIGDNPWPVGSFKYAAVPTYKQAWANEFTLASGRPRFPMRPVGTDFEDTAYAVRMADTLIVTVDVFDREYDGVHATVTGGQLAWLDQLITREQAAGVRHVIVQGHTPVLAPARSHHSSRIFLEGGRSSPFWQVLLRHHVDLYLCGEMHAVTESSDAGVVQVVHGSLSSVGLENYLIGRVYSDRIELQLKAFQGRVTDRRRLWQATAKRSARGVEFAPDPPVVGSMVIAHRDGRTFVKGQTGLLRDGG